MFRTDVLTFVLDTSTRGHTVVYVGELAIQVECNRRRLTPLYIGADSCVVVGDHSITHWMVDNVENVHIDIPNDNCGFVTIKVIKRTNCCYVKRWKHVEYYESTKGDHNVYTMPLPSIPNAELTFTTTNGMYDCRKCKKAYKECSADSTCIRCGMAITSVMCYCCATCGDFFETFDEWKLHVHAEVEQSMFYQYTAPSEKLESRGENALSRGGVYTKGLTRHPSRYIMSAKKDSVHSERTIRTACRMLTVYALHRVCERLFKIGVTCENACYITTNGVYIDYDLISSLSSIGLLSPGLRAIKDVSEKSIITAARIILDKKLYTYAQMKRSYPHQTRRAKVLCSTN